MNDKINDFYIYGHVWILDYFLTPKIAPNSLWGAKYENYSLRLKKQVTLEFKICLKKQVILLYLESCNEHDPI